MSLRTAQNSYGYNPSYDFQMWSSSEVQNLGRFFDMLIYLQPQINIQMSLYIHADYSSCWTN